MPDLTFPHDFLTDAARDTVGFKNAAGVQQFLAKMSTDPLTGGSYFVAPDGVTKLYPVYLNGLSTPVSVAGTTVTTNMATFTIPAAYLTKGAHINVKAIFSAASANNKNFQMLLNDGFGGSLGGTLIYSAGGIALNGTMICETNIWIRDANTQISGQINSVSGAGTTTSQPALTNYNSANGLDLSVVGALSNSADYMTLEALSFEVTAA